MLANPTPRRQLLSPRSKPRPLSLISSSTSSDVRMQPNRNFIRSGMPLDVPQRFLNDTVQRELHVMSERVELSLRGERNRGTSALEEASAFRLHGSDQTDIVER